MAFCKRTQGNWATKCADWATCKGCPCCKGGCDDVEESKGQEKAVQKQEAPQKKQVAKKQEPEKEAAPKSMK